MKHSFAKRLLVLMMAALMLLSVSPVGALAEELDDTPTTETVEPAPEPEEAPAEEATEESSEESTEESTEEPAEESAEETEETTEETAEESAEPAEAVPLALEGEGEEPETATTSVTVTFAASQDTFFVVPTSLTVTDGIAEEYDYDNDSTVTGPTFLDALVAAHIQKYGDSFKTKPTDYLVCSAGSLSKVFGISTYNIACLVNGRMPGNGGLMANQAEIKSGDVVQLLIYQYYDFDYETYEITCDDYCTFTERTKTVAAGESFTLTLTGHSLATEMWGTTVTDVPLAEAYVSVCPVNADGSLGAQIADATADEKGQITLSIGTAGDYLLTVSGMTAEGKPLALPWCRVKVGGMAGLSFAAGSSATAAAYEMNPAFSADETEYAVTVPDNKNALYAKMTLDSGVSSTLTAKYRDKNGADKSVTLKNGQAVSLANALANSSMAGVDVTVAVGDKTYTIHVVREGTLKSFALADAEGSKISFTPNFSATKYEYEANFSGTELKLTPTATTATNSVNVNDTPVASGTAVTITPAWENHEYTVTLAIGGSSYSLKLKEMPSKLEVATPSTKTEYAVGDKFDPTGMTLTATYANGETETIDPAAFAVVTSAALVAQTEVELSYRGVTVTQPITMTEKLTGTGSEDDPYLLATPTDLELLSRMTNAGESFAGKYFKITDNITLPNDWTPIGKKGAYFSGSIDGQNHQITVPSGSQTMIGAPLGAELKNLDIYGENIDGNGVVAIYTTGKSTQAIEISHVTLKSGTHTTGAGFVGGYASGGYKVYIHDCTVESGVVIGDGTASNIGSFGGDFNGTIENCKSSATVRGVDWVGGISGSKGQSMGDYKIIGCTFSGTVIATGNYVGGISGGGYAATGMSSWGGLGSAPNTPCATITGCRVSGSISGGDYVGGILGAEAGVVQCWSNGIGYIQNNVFTGSIASSGTYVGGVIGYMNSLNKYTIIENNVYLCTGAGSDKGIGAVKYVDTNHAAPTVVEGTTYVNSEGAKPSVSGMSKKDCNRTDDPLGVDADKLTTRNSPPVAAEKLIDAIGDVTADSEAAIEAARKAYDALTDSEKSAVSNYELLIKAEAVYEAVAAAAAVEALIEAIGEPEAVTKDSKAAIEAARKAYDALSAEAKALVTNYAKLTAAERKLAALDPAGETKVIGTGDTKLVLDGVTYMVDAEAASLMQTIANLRDAGGTDDEGILSAYRTYDAMSSELKAQVFNFADLEAMCDALGVRAHRDSLSGFAAEGLPWYVGLEITAITDGADYEIVAGSIGHNALLSLWHIEFVNRLTGERFTPYDSVTLRVAAPEMSEGLEQFRMALYADGRVAYSDCTVSGGELIFAVTEGGVYGFIGGTAAATETLVVEDEPVEEAIAEPEAPEAEAAPEIIEPVAEPVAESGHTLLWLWIMIGVAGVAALVVVVVLKRQDRKAKHAVK